MIGRKISCPQCKYRFLVEEPGEAPETASPFNKWLVLALLGGVGVVVLGLITVGVVLVAIVFLAKGTDGAANPDSNRPALQTDLDRLQGAWKMSALVASGVTLQPAAFERYRLTLSGDTFTFAGGNATQRMTITLDSTTNPKSVDAVDLDGPHKGKKQLGIYELTDKQVKICLAQEGSPARPTAFSSTTENKHTLMVLERAGPGDTVPKAKTADWKEFTPASGAFTVKMPGQVTEMKQPVPMPDGSKKIVTIHMAGELTSAFMVVYDDLPPGHAAKTGSTAIFEEMKTRFPAVVPGGVISVERSIKLGKHEGRQWHLSAGGSTMRIRAYLVGDRLFQLTAGPVPPVQEADVQTFFESFRVENDTTLKEKGP
jgi:uncharacterized protein (TIGR03067 family)